MMTAPAWRMFGVPIRVELSFFLVVVLLGADLLARPGLLLAWIVIVFVSILWHELGHAAAMRAFGLRPRIALHFMGGATWPEPARRLRPAQDVAVSLAGPGAGILLGGLTFALASPGVETELGLFVARQLVWVNVGWGVLNLVPILPLDGGRVLQGLLDGATRGRGERPARVASVVVAGAAALLAFRSGFTWAAVLAVIFGAQNLGALSAGRGRADGGDTGERLAGGYARLAEGDHEGAEAVALEVAGGAARREVAATAANLAFWARLLDGRADDAMGTFGQLPPGAVPLLHPDVLPVLGGEEGMLERLQEVFRTSPSDASGAVLAQGLVETARLDEAVALLRGAGGEAVGERTDLVVARALFAADRHREAAAIFEGSFERGGNAVAAYNAAVCHARTGANDEALRWLGRAAEAGYDEAGRAEREPAFEPLRESPSFEQALTRMRVSSQGRDGRD